MSQRIEGSQSSFLFGDFLHLRKNPVLGRVGTIYGLYQELIKEEHALLAAFVWFATGKGEFVIPDIEDVWQLSNANFWPAFGDPTPLGGYYEELPSPGYIRLQYESGFLDVVISFYFDDFDPGPQHNDGQVNFYFLSDDYLRSAHEVAEFEIGKFSKVEPGSNISLDEVQKSYYSSPGQDLNPFRKINMIILGTDKEEIERKKAKEKEKLKISQDKAKLNLLHHIKENAYTPGFVFVDPRLIDGKEHKYQKDKAAIAKEYGWDILKTPYELLDAYKAPSEKYDRWKVAVNSWYQAFLEEEIIPKNKDLFDSYRKKLEKIPYWADMEDQSQDMLCFGDVLFDSLKTTEGNYAVCVVQYCNVLENELRKKVFDKLIDTLKKRYSARLPEFTAYVKDLQSEDCPIMKPHIIKSNFISLGEMGYLFCNVGLLQQTRTNPVAKDVSGFLKYYLPLPETEIIVLGKDILAVNKFRIRAAHPNPKSNLSQKEANLCRVQTISALGKLLKAAKKRT